MNSTGLNKILIIRLHAIGDTAITFPVCNFIKKNYPGCELHFLTTGTTKKLAESFGIFSKVFELDKGFELNNKDYNSIQKKITRLRTVIKESKILKREKYDIIIDLQNNKYSNLISRMIKGKKSGEFEKYQPKSHNERIIDVFTKSGFNSAANNFSFEFNTMYIENCRELLYKHGWNGKNKLVAVNPAGYYESRRWGINNYVKLSGLLLQNGYTVLILGTEKIRDFSETLKSHLDADLINLTGLTDLKDVPGLLYHVNGIVSDDSGLYHIAWAMGIPGVLLLGSTRSDWTCQPGSHSICLNSSDLECGNCMKEICIWGDNHCLTRYTPEFVFEKLKEVMKI